MVQGKTIPYTTLWVDKLRNAPTLNAKELYLLDHAFGKYIGQLVKQFCTTSCQRDPELIGWHGHTVFHDPDRQATLQIGNGAAIAATVNVPVVNQLRSIDVAIGGQGAPLAPLADRDLMPSAASYLNLGGISNITYHDLQGSIHSFDVCPCNQILNRLANERGLPFDDKGTLASKGKSIPLLEEKLNELSYYQLPHPKSIDNNWIVEIVWPIIESTPGSTEDKLYTSVQHIVKQLEAAITQAPAPLPTLLVTGGGVYNKFLISELQKQLLNTEVVIPEDDLVQYKEAALMALMAYYYKEGINNVLHSATGSSYDHIGGCLYHAPSKPKTLHG